MHILLLDILHSYRKMAIFFFFFPGTLRQTGAICLLHYERLIVIRLWAFFSSFFFPYKNSGLALTKSFLKILAVWHIFLSECGTTHSGAAACRRASRQKHLAIECLWDALHYSGGGGAVSNFPTFRATNGSRISQGSWSSNRCMRCFGEPPHRRMFSIMSILGYGESMLL